jgi:hypothetical protein
LKLAEHLVDQPSHTRRRSRFVKRIAPQTVAQGRGGDTTQVRP